MSGNYTPYAPWMNILGGESKPPFEQLMKVHDTLSQSDDLFLQYNAGWAALYAAQKSHDHSDVAYQAALATFQGVSEQEQVPAEVTRGVFGDTSLGLRAEFALALAPQLRHPRVALPAEGRAEVYRGLERVLSKAIIGAEAGNTDKIGFLGELAITALTWRPIPKTLSVLNTVPASPMKDARRRLAPFNTDLYAYHPTIVSTPKGRVNLQVKATYRLKFARFSGYDATAIVVIGLNEVIHTEVNEELSGHEASLVLSRTLLKDIKTEPLTEQEEDMLLYTGAEVYDRIVNLAEEKRERRVKNHLSARAVRNGVSHTE